MITRRTVPVFKERLSTAIGIAMVLAFFAGLVAWEYFQARRPGFLSPGVAQCRIAYTNARTPKDNALVDRTVPSTGPQKGWKAQTCGFLRSSGALR